MALLLHLQYRRENCSGIFHPSVCKNAHNLIQSYQCRFITNLCPPLIAFSIRSQDITIHHTGDGHIVLDPISILHRHPQRNRLRLCPVCDTDEQLVSILHLVDQFHKRLRMGGYILFTGNHHINHIYM